MVAGDDKVCKFFCSFFRNDYSLSFICIRDRVLHAARSVDGEDDVRRVLIFYKLQKGFVCINYPVSVEIISF